MNIANHIDEVRAGIKAGRFGNEASVSQGIVLRILSALGWPTYDTQVVAPEFSLSARRVDFALCHPPGKPAAFVEVKQLGQSGQAERQLFEYAFHAGVPLAILTDGQEWNFFLPAEQGDYTERRVYKLDLLERQTEEVAKIFERYLGYENVKSGIAIASARDDYRNVSRMREVSAKLPEAWTRLVEEDDDLLLELLAEKVEDLCGFKPDIETVSRFLRERIALRPVTLAGESRGGDAARGQPRPEEVKPAAAGQKEVPRPTMQRDLGFTIDGRFTSCRSARDVLVGVFEVLAAQDPTFLERFAARPKHGRTRRYVARTQDELYPGRPDLAREHFHRLKSGWFIGTNVSRAQILRMIEMACEVAPRRFGKELSVEIGD